MLLGISGVLLFLPRPWLAGEPILVIKIVFVTIAFLNGVFLNLYADPAFKRLAAEWAEKTARVRKFELIAGVSAVVSMVAWWGTVLFSLYLVHS